MGNSLFLSLDLSIICTVIGSQSSFNLWFTVDLTLKIRNKMIKLKLPWPPTINHYYTRTRSGKIIKNTRAQLYGNSGQLIIKSQMPKKLTCANYRVDVFVYPPDARKRDLDNLLKGLLDVLQHAGIYSDDYKVTKLYVERREVRALGELEVSVYDADAE